MMSCFVMFYYLHLSDSTLTLIYDPSVWYFTGCIQLFGPRNFEKQVSEAIMEDSSSAAER